MEPGDGSFKMWMSFQLLFDLSLNFKYLFCFSFFSLWIHHEYRPLVPNQTMGLFNPQGPQHLVVLMWPFSDSTRGIIILEKM